MTKKESKQETWTLSRVSKKPQTKHEVEQKPFSPQKKDKKLIPYGDENSDDENDDERTWRSNDSCP